MASDFRLDSSALDRALRISPEAANRGAAIALGDIKNDWVADSVDIAPLDSANLRRQIVGEVFDPGASGRIEVHANATRGGNARFNYAYYIHEQDAGGRGLLTTGTEKKFLDKPLEDNQSKYQQWLEDEVKTALRRAGW